MSFTHLHVHTDRGSVLDSCAHIKPLVTKARLSGMTALAVTDHGTAYASYAFYKECVKQGIKPIIGCEVYEAPHGRREKGEKGDSEKYYHLILLAKNEIGWKNLCYLISRSNSEGFYYKPRIDGELLLDHHEGLICLSACLQGRIPKAIVKGKKAEALMAVRWYRDLFGDDFYLEIQNHGIPQEALVAQEIVRIARTEGIKIVCTNDVHYVNSEDKEAHDWMLCMQTKKTLDDPDRMRYEGDYSLKSEEEMRKLFPALPEAFDNTQEIVDKCDFHFRTADSPADYYMPKVDIPKAYDGDAFAYLTDLTWKGFEKYYPEGHEFRQQAKEGIKYELSVIKEMGFAKYFLLVEGIVRWAKENGVLVGPGRGSAAGSKVCYCLNITELEPIKYDLIFERFLNPSRVTMPDIDVDFSYDKKEFVLYHEAEKNGWTCFAKIATFDTMQPKSAVKDCARVAGLSVAEGNTFAKLVGDSETLAEAYESEDLKVYVRSTKTHEKVWEIACKLEGTVKSVGTHACGHVPTHVPCEQLVPVHVDAESGLKVMQFEAPELEELGLLKMDFLMLKTLAVISQAHELVKRRYGITVPTWNDEIKNDKKAFEVISAGDTNGVFQLESDGMKKFMQQLKPSCFEDIIAGIALYRPGPMDFIPAYIEGKKKPESITYLTPELEPILSPTYGQIIYQEQVILIAQKLAGFSMARADVLRKAMGKKRMDIMQEERKNFVYGNTSLNIPGCIKKGISEEIANKIYDQMIDFAKYAFNKSHSAAYACLAMQMAYLKAHYPLEFAAAMLTSVTDDSDKLAKYSEEYKKKGILILPPDVNSSSAEFDVSSTGDAIIFGLSSIKNVGRDDVEKILEKREMGLFKNFTDFIRRCEGVNLKAYEQLIKAGAFDFTGHTRATLLNNLEECLKYDKKKKKKQIEGQISMFDILSPDSFLGEILRTETLEAFPELSFSKLLAGEKEALGYYLSGHPVTAYKQAAAVFNPAKSVVKAQVGNACLLGLISDLKVTYTKRDHRKMCLFTISDAEGSLSAVMFPDAYAENASYIDEGMICILKGQIKPDNEGKMQLVCNDIYPLSDDTDKAVFIQVPDMIAFQVKEDDLNHLAMLHQQERCQIVFFVKKAKRYMPVKVMISSDEGALSDLRELYGVGNVILHQYKKEVS